MKVDIMPQPIGLEKVEELMNMLIGESLPEGMIMLYQQPQLPPKSINREKKSALR